MNDKIRCQSCAMPLSDQFANFGTEDDGSKNSEYCVFCFKKGAFTIPDQTLQEMIQSSIENMTSDLGMSEDKAAELANAVIPNLGRWRED